MIYFDSAATSLLKPEEVKEAVYKSFEYMGNAGRGAHDPTLMASRLIYDTREKLSWLFDADNPSSIAFTANVTQALNTAISGSLRAGDHVITTVAEHNSVLRPLYHMEEKGVELSILQADESGRIDPEQFRKEMRPNTRAIVVSHASNVTGNIMDLSRLAEIIHQNDGLFIVDAAQTAGSIDISMKKMGLDILCFTGHKGLMGPQGTGGICIRNGLEIKPLVRGGSGVQSFLKEHPKDMPTALEAGTLNGHGIAGLNAGLDFIEKTGIHEIHLKEMKLMRRFLSGLDDLKGIIRFYGDMNAADRAPIVTLNMGNLDAAYVSDLLWEDYEICVRAGAHCAPLIHRHFNTEEGGAVRFSFSYFNTEEEVDTALEAIHDIAEEVSQE